MIAGMIAGMIMQGSRENMLPGNTVAALENNNKFLLLLLCRF